MVVGDHVRADQEPRAIRDAYAVAVGKAHAVMGYRDVGARTEQDSLVLTPRYGEAVDHHVGARDQAEAVGAMAHLGLVGPRVAATGVDIQARTRAELEASRRDRGSLEWCG